MTAPRYYLVADTDAFILDSDGITVYGAPVNSDGTLDMENAYDFNSDSEDIEYIAHMSNELVKAAKLHQEHHYEAFFK